MAPGEINDSDRWAAETEAHMTDEERVSLLHGVMNLPFPGFDMSSMPADAVPGAGYVHGVPRLGVPSLRETDASLGVTNPDGVRPNDTATAFPSSLALAASFDPTLARRVGEVLGREAKQRGFNVLLGGGVNLARDPRNGRNFEYLSEDPLLSGVMAGEEVAGTQSQGVISTVKHFSLNSLETNRLTANAVLDLKTHRESDLLAFEIAIERGQPGAVMGAYNRVNGEPCCGSDTLLNKVLKGAWKFPGWVMSDWGAVGGWEFALNGLDQQSGSQLDRRVWFDGPLKDALRDGGLPRDRLSDMVRRILRSMHAVGLTAPAPPHAHGGRAVVVPEEGDALALEVARSGIVLLKNDGLLPLDSKIVSLAVIGGRARTGVLSGGGSAQTMPPGGWTASIPVGGEGPMASLRVERWFGSTPVRELTLAVQNASIEYDPGAYPEDAEALARRCDAAIVFAARHEMEGFDIPNITLPYGKDEVIARVAKANPNTIVVLETGNPVAMPWLDSVKAVIAAWYPGQKGAQAIAEIIAGKVNPSGRLPMTFPKQASDSPRPELPGLGARQWTPTTITYPEGADAGYRWYARKGIAPLFPFGHGLSYTMFARSGLKVSGGDTIRASFTVANTGAREGSDAAQLYLTSINGSPEKRLIAFKRVTLGPGESTKVEVEADPRLLAHYHPDAQQWSIAGGSYAVALAADAADAGIAGEAKVDARKFGA
ncbi:MAG TPA: glycoside hydrolase family 3 C-terminal domain-containing protein [Hyphomonadaceae bacterium]|nr:glycoside hydrolase family 3 C-terminal domain-containing protein [Hyphomonadaceae bacterium]